MRRSLAAVATAALVASTFAFAPAVASQADTTHEVTFSETGTKTIQGGLPGGVNLTPFLGIVGIDQECTDSLEGYCETILIQIDQPVENTDDEVFEFGLGTFHIDVTADVPGSDFDLYVYESNANGDRGPLWSTTSNSGNAPLCTVACGVVPFVYNNCRGVDECVDISVSTNELEGTRYVLAEIYYFATPAGYTANLNYTRVS